MVDEIDTKATNAKEFSQITRDQLVEELKELNKMTPDQAELLIEKYNEKVIFYTQQRDSECKGEFSSIEINEKGESEVVKRKLSKDEVKLCLVELVNFRKNYVNEIFNVRKKILIRDQNDQLNQLENIRNQNIQKLDEIATKLSK